MFTVDCVSKSGGMASLWGNEILVDLQNFSLRHINCSVETEATGSKRKLTGFYGPSVAAKRYEAWELLKYLANLNPTPWICVGDFNEVVSLSEKWGGGGRSSRQMRDFQLALEDCDLVDLGYRGLKYTWSNCREGYEFTKERLDRGVANSEWRDLFSKAEVSVEATANSDHAMIHIFLMGQQQVLKNRSRFRYKASWALERDYKAMLHNAWNFPTTGGGTWEIITEKLNKCQKETYRWQEGKWGSTRKSITKLQQKLNLAQGNYDVIVGENEKLLRRELNRLLDQEDLKWKQREKVDW